MRYSEQSKMVTAAPMSGRPNALHMFRVPRPAFFERCSRISPVRLAERLIMCNIEK
jgi:hypothetical protein